MERRAVVRGRPRAATGGPAGLRPRRVVDVDDPFSALLDVWLAPSTPPARWAVVAGDATAASVALEAATADRVPLVIRSGDADADALLADLSPVLGRLLDDLTTSQRRIVRLLLADGLRQADAADALGISRASVSVAYRRARVRELGLLLRAIRAAWAAGQTMGGDGRWPEGGGTVPR
jgi:hypothetical protein